MSWRALELRFPKNYWEVDRLIERRGYSSRSEAVRDLVRKEPVDETTASSSAEAYGAVTLLYDHHPRLLLDKLTDVHHRLTEYLVNAPPACAMEFGPSAA